jgi:hypothetical protein
VSRRVGGIITTFTRAEKSHYKLFATKIVNYRFANLTIFSKNTSKSLLFLNHFDIDGELPAELAFVVTVLHRDPQIQHT